LAKQELGLTLSVPNRLQEDGEADELAVQLRVNSMKDFNRPAWSSKCLS
jgi:type VI secretion system protein ImpB